MALALAQGKLNEFLAEEFPDNENARKLADVMMRMTGMAAPAAGTGSLPEKKLKGRRGAEDKEPPGAVDSSPSEGTETLVNLLGGTQNKEAGRAGKRRGKGTAPEGEAFLDKDVIDTLMKIAEENKVSLDWVMARALRLYTRDYVTTGRI
jgi:hypothetical protein